MVDRNKLWPGLSSALILFLPVLALAQSEVIIDFEGLTEGQIVDQVSVGSGITLVSGSDPGGQVDVDGNNNKGRNVAAIFEAECLSNDPFPNLPSGCTGNDADLFNPGFGNILIVDVTGDKTGDGIVDGTKGPNDDENGGVLTLDFRAFNGGAVTVLDFMIFDIENNDETAGTIDFETLGGGVTTIPVVVTGNGGRALVPVDLADVVEMRVNFAGSGSIDDIRLIVGEPTPTATPTPPSPTATPTPLPPTATPTSPPPTATPPPATPTSPPPTATPTSPPPTETPAPATPTSPPPTATPTSPPPTATPTSPPPTETPVPPAEIGEGCLTRTPGFWKNHPNVTGQFLPVESCGLVLDEFTEVAEDMCINGGEAKAANTSMQQLQLIRQCAAANLNVAASASGGGSCETEFPAIAGTIADCCNDADSVCRSGLSGIAIGASSCIEELDAFNNSEDSLEGFGPFESPGRADSGACNTANDNRTVNPGRNLGPR